MTIKAEIGKLYAVTVPSWTFVLESSPLSDDYKKVLQYEIFMLLEIDTRYLKSFSKVRVLLKDGTTAYSCMSTEEFNECFLPVTQ